MNEDKIQIIGKFETVEDRPYSLLLKVAIEINGVVIKSQHVDVYSLALYWSDHTPSRDKNYPYSAFYPFSCNCGVAGCASIWDGIYVKSRKHSVEWRASKADGYKFLPKRFFSFDKAQYLKAQRNFLFWLKMEAFAEYDYKMCVDLGHYTGDETTVEDFFRFIEER